MRIKDFLRFIICAGLFVVALTYVYRNQQPRKKRDDDSDKKEAARPLSKQRTNASSAAVGSLAGPFATIAERLALESLEAKDKPKVRQPRLEPKPGKQFLLGSTAADSPFHLHVEFDSLGGAVRRLVLNKFKSADRLGLPVDTPLELIPPPSDDVPLGQQLLANVLYHYEDGDRPVDTLARRHWDVGPVQDGNASNAHSISFKTTVRGVRITKTFRLPKHAYHLELDVKLERIEEKGPEKFRYQLTGAHNLPVEGEWYTSTFRHALIGRLEKGALWRSYQDLQEISNKEGGDAVETSDNKVVQYAAVAVQYFAAVIAVNDEQVEDQNRDFLASARPTLEARVIKVDLDQQVSPNDRTLTVRFKDRTKKEETYDLTPAVAAELAARPWKKGDRFGLKIVSQTREDSENDLAVAVLPDSKTQPMFQDDITVRVNTEPIDLRDKAEVTHRYLLYNGPIKPKLLGQLYYKDESGKTVRQMESAEVDRYVDTLHLNTLTDYRSPGALGKIASAIYLTNLIVLFTNLCHNILYLLNQLIPSYGICIILLTVIVRGAMFPLSRKQAMMGMKMQELAPELKKLKEKHKDDRQAFAMAQMELFRKHGVNPLGTCWMLLLQLPIFMGLYYCLQESVHFRLASFLWIPNLAAPDMTLEWGERVPFLSRPEDYGSIIYLGPFLNILPILAVSLMIYQQKALMPPPADEQAAMQQKIMKYMMIFFGLLFYKVAAGLCIYFIASSLWGFAERKWLPKKKPTTEGGSADALYQKMRGDVPAVEESRPVSNGQNITTASNRAKRRQDRKRQRERANAPTASEPSSEAVPPVATGWWAKMRNWWQDVLKKASKK